MSRATMAPHVPSIKDVPGHGPAARIRELFHLVDLPAGDGPVFFAVGMPGEALLAHPLFPRAALPSAGRLASGRGMSREECHIGCLGEAAELVSCCAWGDEALITATDREIGSRALLPEALNGFAPDQTRRRSIWNRQYGGLDWRPAARRSSAPLDWLVVENAHDGSAAFVPADFALIGRRQAGDAAAVAIGDSSGCAAGPDVDAAKLAALLELVERDAVGRWWYGRRRRPPTNVSRTDIPGPMAAWLAARARRTWVFDITTDLGIPVVAAASAEPDGRDISLGCAARPDLRSAASAAVTEMLQMEVSLHAARLLGDAAHAWAYWRALVTMSTPPLDAAVQAPVMPLRPPRRSPAGAGLSAVLEACERSRVDVFFADRTRPEIGVAAFRAFSTTLCHSKPRFGRHRLLAADGRDMAPAAAMAAGPWLTI